MDARSALVSGDVRQAMDLLKAEVRRAPRDARSRTFLFQMFCITGEWDRALTQLTVAGELDPLAFPMVQTYQVLIRCEVLREKVFSGQRSPTVMGDPGDWLPLLIEATRLLGTGEPARAAQLRDAALETAPPTPARINDQDAEWIGDADPRLGPVLEAIIDGRYLWIAYDRIKEVAIDPPSDLRDQVWTPARFTWANEGTAVGFIPTRYPGSVASEDPALLLAHRTEWRETDDWALPIGQRMLVTDQAETALMDIRTIALRKGGATASA